MLTLQWYIQQGHLMLLQQTGLEILKYNIVSSKILAVFGKCIRNEKELFNC
jgi:hypothetical protein